MSRQQANIRKILVGLPFVALLISCAPLLIGGFPDGHDWVSALVRIAETRYALQAGQLPPYWAGDLYGGYGSPIFLYYAPGFSLVAALFADLLDSVTNGGVAALVLFTLISLVGIELLMREVIGTRSPESFAAARVAAYIYLLNPYLLNDKLLRNANAEFAALCIAPLVFYGLMRIQRDQRGGLIILAMAFGTTILLHNLTALVVAALLLTGSVVLYLRTATTLTWISIVCAIVLGLGLAAFFWMPSLGLMSLVRPEELLTGKYDFRSQFQPLGTFFIPRHSFSVGLIPLILLVLSIWLGWFIRDKSFPAKTVFIFALVFAAVFLFLQIPASTFLWENVPYLPFFGFPWRMMGPFAFMLAIASAIAFAFVLRKRPGWFGLFAEMTVFIICVLNAVPHLRAYTPIAEKYQVNLPEVLTSQGIKNLRISGTAANEYLLRTAHADAWMSQPPVHGPVVQSDPPARIVTRTDTGTKIVLDVEAEQPSRLRLARWNFPGWELELNGKRADVLTNEFGSIDISVPVGKTTVVLELEPPLLRQVCLWLSMTSLALLILILLGWPHHLWTRLRQG